MERKDRARKDQFADFDEDRCRDAWRQVVRRHARRREDAKPHHKPVPLPKWFRVVHEHRDFIAWLVPVGLVVGLVVMGAI